MTISPSRQFLVVVAATLQLCVLTCAEIQRKKDNEGKFSGDFQNFLRDMESIVFKGKDNVLGHYESIRRVPQYTTSNPHLRRHTNILRTQKAAIRDALMLKLVSYYEDKYKVAQHETSTTTKVTTSPSSKVPIRRIIKKASPLRTSDTLLNDIEVDPSAEVVVL